MIIVNELRHTQNAKRNILNNSLSLSLSLSLFAIDSLCQTISCWIHEKKKKSDDETATKKKASDKQTQKEKEREKRHNELTRKRVRANTNKTKSLLYSKTKTIENWRNRECTSSSYIFFSCNFRSIHFLLFVLDVAYSLLSQHEWTNKMNMYWERERVRAKENDIEQKQKEKHRKRKNHSTYSNCSFQLLEIKDCLMMSIYSQNWMVAIVFKINVFVFACVCVFLCNNVACYSFFLLFKETTTTNTTRNLFSFTSHCAICEIDNRNGGVWSSLYHVANSSCNFF